MTTLTPEFFKMVDANNEHFRQLTGRPPLDAKCERDFEKHAVIGHTGQIIKCCSCQGTDRAPIPWAEVMRHG